MDNLLSIVIFLPSLAALILAVILRGEDELSQRNAKILALIATLATFVISLPLLTQFDPTNTSFQFVEEYNWLAGLKYKVGLDGISILFVMLTTFLMPIVIGACWTVTSRVKEYMIMFLLLETMMLAVFSSLDIILFYVVFEAGLIPMFLIVGIWGGKDRIYAAFKLFLYTLLGSVLMLVAIIYMWFEAGTTDIPTLMQHQFSSENMIIFGITIVGGVQTLLFLGFFASFAVKMPMWPVHTWLPDAHVQAPTVTDILTDSWYNYEAKYVEGGSQHVVPANLPEDIFSACLDYALKAHEVLGCRGISRTDFRWDEGRGLDGLVLLETNTQPGMTPTSLSPEQAEAVNISFPDLCKFLVEDASCDR